ncbi:MAG: hypothetical protein AAFY88_06850, partial [Acidobacteriota bacterium]
MNESSRKRRSVNGSSIRAALSRLFFTGLAIVVVYLVARSYRSARVKTPRRKPLENDGNRDSVWEGDPTMTAEQPDPASEADRKEEPPTGQSDRQVAHPTSPKLRRYCGALLGLLFFIAAISWALTYLEPKSSVIFLFSLSSAVAAIAVLLYLFFHEKYQLKLQETEQERLWRLGLDALGSSPDRSELAAELEKHRNHLFPWIKWHGRLWLWSPFIAILLAS